jgi:hypothetical protein
MSEDRGQNMDGRGLVDDKAYLTSVFCHLLSGTKL